MNRFILIVFLIIINTSIFAQGRAENDSLLNPTHVLELIQGASDDTIRVDVTITSENNIDYIFILTPDENLLKSGFIS